MKESSKINSRWKLSIMAAFAALSSIGYARTEAGTANLTQVLVGMAAFIALWITAYKWFNRQK